MAEENNQDMMAQYAEIIIQGLKQELPESQYQETKQQECLIEMPDGVKLNANIYMPKKSGSWPVILIRGPYTSVDMMFNTMIAPVFAKYGYTVVVTQVRGTLKSEGEWLPFEHEREDGRAVIDWIAGQEWCDGNIGCFGASYLGHTQWCVADYQHPMLKTLYISVYGVDAYNIFYRRGMFRQEIWTVWAAQMMEDNRFKLLMPQDGIELSKNAYEATPQAELGLKLKGKECSWYSNWIENTSEDSPYWNSGFWKELKESIQDIKIPLFLHGGWFDIFLRPQINSFRSLPADVRDKSRFLIGPWHHNGIPGGTLEYPEENRAGMMQIKAALEWFDYHLKGKAYPHELGVIEAYSIRDSKWNVWKEDFSAEEKKTFYFDCQNSSEGKLSEECPVSEVTSVYTYDPSNPVQSVGGTLLANNRDPFGQPECSTVQMKVGEREDVISFVSDKVKQDMCITGAMEAHLFVSSSAPATAFTVKVMEVLPDGSSINIRDDITDIRWVEEHTVQPYTPGSVVELTLQLLDIQWMLAAGSKLRVDIASSNYPAYHVHPNTEELWSHTTNHVTAVQTIYSGESYPSRIILPINRS